MENHLFGDFESVSSKQWKQKIQFELKGADYNDVLVWESPEGIKVKPFYNSDDSKSKSQISTPKNGIQITQNIYVFDTLKSNKKAISALDRGAEAVRFTIENESVSIESLMIDLPNLKVKYYFHLLFLSIDFVKVLNDFSQTNKYDFIVQLDPIGQLVKDGNWFENLDKDFQKLNTISQYSQIPTVTINAGIYQNAGANMVQQLAFTMAHLNEYFNRVKKIEFPVHIEVAIGSNYFFEIAKLRSIRLLFKTLAKEYGHDLDCHIMATPTKRNKTIYDYNVNMLRTTTECMSAILGGANAVSNLAYDSIYHKDNEFGDRIARNQLLILKEESYFDRVSNAAEGSYYIETLIEQLSQKALLLFKDIEANGGFITQLIEGTIQRKVTENAQKEMDLYESGKEILLGTHKFINTDDRMKNDLELYPFVKIKPRKTLIKPLIEKRIAEKIEQERLNNE